MTNLKKLLMHTLYLSLYLTAQTAVAVSLYTKTEPSRINNTFLIAANDMSTEAITARIKPIGEVRTDTNKASAPSQTNVTSPTVPSASQVPAISSTPAATTTTPTMTPTVQTARSPEIIYKQNCIICHEAGVAGAPKFRNKDDWNPREKQGFSTLLATAIKGLNAMPPKGNCIDCTDAEMKSTIQYMLPK